MLIISPLFPCFSRVSAGQEASGSSVRSVVLRPRGSVAQEDGALIESRRKAWLSYIARPTCSARTARGKLSKRNETIITLRSAGSYSVVCDKLS